RARRERPHIALSPDQPPTTQGKPRTRVFVACLQCRRRKIRCDGAKPSCYNCNQRGASGDECCYDAAPKRRGPDRVPGARTRGSRLDDDEQGRPRRTRRPRTPPPSSPPQDGFSPVSPSDAFLPHVANTFQPPALPSALHISPIPYVSSETSSLSPHSYAPVDLYANHPALHASSPSAPDPYSPVSHRHSQAHDPDLYYAPPVSSAYIESEDGSSDDDAALLTEPSVDFVRRTWWDHLLELYTPAGVPLTATARNQAMHTVFSDVKFLFRATSYWWSFLHVRRFFSTLSEPSRRARTQPSLVLAALAVARLLQSSEYGSGRLGMHNALALRDEAQAALDASINARAIDEELAQAAWILAFFEQCCHPDHQHIRVRGSLHRLDSLIRALALPSLDASNPQASAYEPRTVPTVSTSPAPHAPNTFGTSMVPGASTVGAHGSYATSPPCGCDALTVGGVDPSAREVTPQWVQQPAWQHEWSEAEVRRESCRRLAWMSMTLVAGYTSYGSAAGHEPLNCFVVEPANFNLLFPGEALAGKESVWALYVRAMLLWHSCLVAPRTDASFAMRAWLESEAIERALNAHTCSIERTLIYYGREYLFNSRMAISFDFQRFIPQAVTGINREKSEEWLRTQGGRAKMAAKALGEISGNPNHTLLQRPYFVWWFMGQVQRALKLWALDKTLTVALDVCRDFMAPIEFLTLAYP
ncbi:hypothetical protein K488DRAFT_17648, partial [Vararia minispora EC-137]